MHMQKENRSQLKSRKNRESKKQWACKKKIKLKPYEVVMNQYEIKMMTYSFANKFSTSHKQKNWSRCWDPLPANYGRQLIPAKESKGKQIEKGTKKGIYEQCRPETLVKAHDAFVYADGAECMADASVIDCICLQLNQNWIRHGLISTDNTLH